MGRYPVPAPRVVGGHPKNHSGRDNNPITRFVVHSAVMPCEPGRAQQLADMNRKGSTGGSWHYATDPDDTIQCSYDSYVCWHAPPNGGSVGVEMADYPAPKHKYKIWRWAGKNHRKMLKRTARLAAEFCLGYELPIQFLGVKQLRNGQRGITTHAKVSKAFGQSTHWDPGHWPRRYFMYLVRKEAEAIRAAERKKR